MAGSLASRPTPGSLCGSYPYRVVQGNSLGSEQDSVKRMRHFVAMLSVTWTHICEACRSDCDTPRVRRGVAVYQPLGKRLWTPNCTNTPAQPSEEASTRILRDPIVTRVSARSMADEQSLTAIEGWLATLSASSTRGAACNGCRLGAVAIYRAPRGVLHCSNELAPVEDVVASCGVLAAR